MAYTIKNSRNVTVATIADGAKDESTNITLIGKNFLGYGTALNTDLYYILENFASTTAPTKPVQGQLWYDTSVDDLKVYTTANSWTYAVKTGNSLTLTNNLAVNGGNITSTAATANLLPTNVTALNIGAAASTVNIGNTTGAGTTTVKGNLVVAQGDISFNASTTVGIANATVTTLNMAGAATTVNIGYNSTTVNMLGTIQAGNIVVNNVNAAVMQNGNSNVTITANSAVSVAANGAVRLTVAANGSTGFGTATPSYQIETTQAVKVGTYLGVGGNPSSTVRILADQGADYTLGTNYAYYISGSGYSGGIALDATSMQIGQNSGSRSLTFHSGASWAKRMTIDGASGNVGIANTSPAHTLSVTGTMNISGNANVGNLGATTVVATTGNIDTVNATTANATTINSGLMQNGNSNVSITANSNVSVFVAGNVTARAVFTSTGANIAGTANISGNANVGNIGTAQVLASANITAPQFISNVATGTAPLSVASTTQVANLNAAVAGNLINGTSNVTLAASGNIGFSVGGTASVVTISGQSLGVTGQFFSTGSNSGYYIRRRDTNADTYVMYSTAGILTYYDAVGGADRLYLNASGVLYPAGNGTQSLGTTTNRWGTVWGTSSSSLYADLAERYESDADYAPGTVLEIGGDKEVTICDSPRSDRVFGCVSTDPAYLMNDVERDGHWVPVVLTGRAPIKVSGPVRKGDRLVSAGNGAAMAAGTFGSSYQTEIGRALQSKTSDGVELIEAYISTC